MVDSKEVLDIRNTKKGISIKDNEKSIFLSRPEVLNVGCKNCIWKLNHQCPHGLSDNEFLDEGYCKEMIAWLFSLAGNSTSSTVLWERYHLFTTQLQASEDYRRFKQMDKEISLAEKEKSLSKEELQGLEAKRNNLRYYWTNLTMMILKSLSKTADRESRTDNVDKMVSKVMSISDFNRIMQEEIKTDEPIPAEYSDVVEEE